MPCGAIYDDYDDLEPQVQEIGNKSGEGQQGQTGKWGTFYEWVWLWDGGLIYNLTISVGGN